MIIRSVDRGFFHHSSSTSVIDALDLFIGLLMVEPGRVSRDSRPIDRAYVLNANEESAKRYTMIFVMALNVLVIYERLRTLQDAYVFITLLDHEWNGWAAAIFCSIPRDHFTRNQIFPQFMLCLHVLYQWTLVV